MEFPQLRMESTSAQIGIQTKNAKNYIQQPMADLSIEQPKAELSIITTSPRLTIDQSQARADVDLKSISQRVDEFSQKGYQDLLAGIARRVNQGNQLMKIENSGNPIVSQAKQNSEKPAKEFGITFVPSYGSIKINYEPAKVYIEAKENKPKIDVKLNKPNVQYEQGNVEIYLQKRNELKISVDFVDIKA
ncbi:DUF6470 family protein [Metabacillus sp. B2-18]|uniref:DUF6470 family protein n=1 Tax=Metabacillus sp. B2-18 TaxID=2897333 RepID=UPI001E2D442A|nr:DUF6470 family protein [Metabacillus sp. B2-18]UGB30438.1 DUF6470 family protein [Metabacillus sp. B2-18]